ncbi:17676_t:CDS:1, partial [Entrophospora sp. SA101]
SSRSKSRSTSRSTSRTSRNDRAIYITTSNLALPTERLRLGRHFPEMDKRKTFVWC